MTTFEYTITDPQGIHARPAGEFVKKCASYGCTVKVAKGDREVSAKGILGVMSLGVKQGETITVSCDGDGEAAAAEDLQNFLKANL